MEQQPVTFWKRLVRGVVVAAVAALVVIALPLPSLNLSKTHIGLGYESVFVVRSAHAGNDSSADNLGGEANIASAAKEDSEDSEETWLGGLIKGAMFALIQFFGWVTLSLFEVLTTIAQYNGFTTEPIVVLGWTIVRDVCNMFFVFAMLLIAFGTILRIQAYHYRSLLFRVVLMAVLMNLSKSIVGVLIDLSQVVLLSFVSGFKDMAGPSLAYALGMDKVLQLEPKTLGTIEGIQQTGGNVSAAASAGSLTASFILAALMMALIFITVLAITVQLITRVIKLWILTIMAPIAFAGTLFKATGSMVGKWWDELTKELVAGPTLVFFLWLVLAISASNSGEIFGDGSHTAGSFNPLNLPAADAGNLVNMLVTIGLLWAGLGAAKAGGTAAAGVAGFGLAKITGAGRGAATWTGRKARGAAVGVGRFAGRWASYGAAKTGLEARYEMAKEGIKQSAPGKFVRSFGKEATEQRWAKRDAERQRLVEQHFGDSAQAARRVGDEASAGWMESARSSRAAKSKAEQNKAVLSRMKDYEEKGVSDDSTIRASLDGNMRADGTVIDEVAQVALLNQLKKHGVLTGDVSGDIIKYTAGMRNAEQVQKDMQGVFKDNDLTKLKAKLGGKSVQEQADEELRGDETREKKGRRFKDIGKKVSVGADGRVADEAGVAILMSESFDKEYYDALGSRKAEVDDAYLKLIKNTVDPAERQAIIDKFNQTTGRSGTDAIVFDSDGNVEQASGKNVNGVAEGEKLAKRQAKDFNKQGIQADQQVISARDGSQKLSETEKAFQQLWSEMPNAQKSIDALRVAISKLNGLDPVKNAGLWSRARVDLAAAQADLLTEASAAATRTGMSFVDAEGKPVKVEDFLHERIGGDIAKVVGDLEAQATGPNAVLGTADVHKRLQVLNQGVAARVERAETPEASTVAGFGVTPYGKMVGAATIPGVSYQLPRQKAARLAQQGGFRTASVARLQAAAANAYRAAEAGDRSRAVNGVLESTQKLAGRIGGVKGMNPVQQREAHLIEGEVARLRTLPPESVAQKDLDAVIDRLAKLKSLA